MTNWSKVSRRSALSVAGGLLGGALVGCSTQPNATEDVGFAGGDGSITRMAISERIKAPVLSGTDLEGKPLTSAGHDGSVVVLNVWGSWCSPCRHEAPALAAAAQRTTGRAVFLGINTRDPEAAPAQAFVRAFEVPYANFFDPGGALLLQLKTLPPSAIPSTVFIDPQGRIAARILGTATEATFVGMIDDLVAGK